MGEDPIVKKHNADDRIMTDLVKQGLNGNVYKKALAKLIKTELSQCLRREEKKF